MTGSSIRPATGGFTLLEVLVAIAIFAIVGLGANQMLRTMIRADEQIQARTADLDQYSRAVFVLQRDLAQFTHRSVRDEYGERLAALMVNTGAYPLEFTSSGWRRPELVAGTSELRRIGFQVADDGNLQRLVWRVLDRAEDSVPDVQVLATGVTGMRLAVIDADGDALTAWPEGDEAAPFPAALELVIDTERLGELRQVYALTQPASEFAEPHSPGGDSNDGVTTAVELTL